MSQNSFLVLWLLLGLRFAIAIPVLCLVYLAGLGIYNLFFHPLHKFPGPKLNAVTRTVKDYWSVRGVLAYRVAELHRRYGPVVRINPYELSFIDPEAWKDSHGFLAPGKRQLSKDSRHYGRVPFLKAMPSNIPHHDHARHRRNFSAGFSDKTLRQQEEILSMYFDLLVKKLHGRVDREEDICMWYNAITFDIIADLTFGESFGCLENEELHWFVKNMMDGFQSAFATRIAGHYPWPLNKMILFTVPKTAHRHLANMRSFGTTKVDKRLAQEKSRPDFMSGAIENLSTNFALSREEIDANATTFIAAGSETTATALSTATWLLCKDPARLAKVVSEVRGAFATEAEITMASVNQLKYMIAVLSEALRILPPVSGSTPRVTEDGGNIIAGREIPGNTACGVPQWTASHSPLNFRDPEDFVPERWLGDPKYKDDRRSASMPFSTGPRNCIGQNLALAEMRTILARLLWNFDFELCEESSEWMKGMKAYSVWKRPKLMVKLKAATRD